MEDFYQKAIDCVIDGFPQRDGWNMEDYKKAAEEEINKMTHTDFLWLLQFVFDKEARS